MHQIFIDVIIRIFFSLYQTGYLHSRYILAVLGCVAFAIIYGLKVNLSVAIVGMVNHTATNAKDNHSHNFQGECGSDDSNISTTTTSHEVKTKFVLGLVECDLA